MVKQSIDERRQAIRAKRILSIQYRLVKSSNKFGDTKWYLSTTQDMSAVGIAFYSKVPYNIDDVLELHVVMSGILDIFKGFGRVVRVEKTSGAVYLIAIEFAENPAAASSRKSVAKAVDANRVNKGLKRK